MMAENNLIVATAQFENKSGDKKYNLEIMRGLIYEAASAGASIISFHECCITGYTFAQRLTRNEILDLAEEIPDGESIRQLPSMALEFNIAILAGLFEKDTQDNLFKAYVCVDGSGLIAKHRKLHPFINPFVQAGESYTTFSLCGWKFGILICYNNNVIENVRATVLLGAEVIFMPHVTMCTPSTRPGAGFINPELWKNRKIDNKILRQEFDGTKGREWLMKWLPARAYDNGIYCVFSNPIGLDDDQLKNVCAMILDPFGNILSECRDLDNQVALSTLERYKLKDAGGKRYLNARRPELYEKILSQAHESKQVVSWKS